jgi:hypothetical protein
MHSTWQSKSRSKTRLCQVGHVQGSRPDSVIASIDQLPAAGEIRKLIAFCGLDWDDACLSPDRNKRSITTASMWQARQPVCTKSAGRWRRYEPWLGEFRRFIPQDAI